MYFSRKTPSLPAKTVTKCVKINTNTFSSPNWLKIKINEHFQKLNLVLIFFLTLRNLIFRWLARFWRVSWLLSGRFSWFFGRGRFLNFSDSDIHPHHLRVMNIECLFCFLFPYLWKKIFFYVSWHTFLLQLFGHGFLIIYQNPRNDIDKRGDLDLTSCILHHRFVSVLCVFLYLYDLMRARNVTHFKLHEKHTLALVAPCLLAAYSCICGPIDLQFVQHM